STLLPAVLFRAGENAFLAAAALDKPDGNKDERDRLYNLAVVRYGRLVEKYPEFAQVNLAKFGLAQSYYRLGKFPQAVATLVTIPDAERTGDLATASYVQADALVRTFPPEADDAIQAAGLIQKAEQAASLLGAFVGSNAKSPLVPDAMLKLGYCYQRMAGLLADKPDRDKAIQLSREAYEKHQQQFRDHPSTAGVVFERARLMAIQGDVGGSMNELRRFTQPPLNAAPNAPLAAVRLAALMRSQGQAKEAAELLARVRAEQEAALLRDPARADWAPMLALEHAAAVREAGKPAEARPLFEGVAAKWPDKPEALTGAWRGVQCRREELAAMTADARKKLGQPGLPAPEAAAAEQQLRTVVDQAAAATAPLGRLLEKFTQKEFAGSEPHLRVLYEMAWCDRTAADAEVELARYAARRAARDKLMAKRAGAPAGQTPPVAMLPDVPAAAVPPTDGEKRARDRYQKLIAAGPDKPTGALAMFELAELVADRGEPDKAVELLNKALLAGPPQELAERVRLRLAACFLAKGDGKTAAVAAKPVADTLKPNAQPTPVQAEARFLLAEALVQQKEWGKAIELLVPFRDQGPFQNVPGVSDRAVLRLGQAYAQSNQWDPARQAFDVVAQRYPQSPWADEARFGTAFALQNKGQFDEAVNAYQQVTARTAAEVAARAQVHIGLCRAGQKKYADATAALLSVPYTYDYPEWSAAACYEAARAFKEMQKTPEAVGLFKRVIDDYPQTKSAPLARARLDEMK
ncbi:MAG TPA: tetratricopeptide repeat protein, partial [Humisphaera sp.]